MPVCRGVAEGPCHTFLPGTEQFCTVLQRRVNEAVKGSKEQFPASSSDGLLTLLEKALWGPQHRESRRTMRVFCEKLGVLGPIYRLVGEGFSDREIAGRLRLSEPVVTNCIAWMLHSFKFTDRAKLAADAFSAAQPSTSEAHLRAS